MEKILFSRTSVVETCNSLRSGSEFRFSPLKIYLIAFLMLVLPFKVDAASPLTVGTPAGQVHTVSGSETYTNITVGAGAGNQGTVNAGDGATLTDSGETLVGDQGQGSINVTSGGTLNTFRSWIGSDINGTTTGNGTVTVTGTGSTWTDTTSILVGAFGTGALTISDGATLNMKKLGIGRAEWAAGGSGTGSVTITGPGDNRAQF